MPMPLAAFLIPWMQPIEGMSRTESALTSAGLLALTTAVMSVLFYIGARLEFALFDIVLYKAQFVAPLWRKYRQHTWRWAGLKIAFATIICTFIGFPLYGWFAHSMSQFPTQSAQSASPELVGSFWLMWLISMCWIVFFLLTSSLLGDFVLPYIALDEAPLSAAVRAFINLFKLEPWQMLCFSFFKVVLAIAGLIAMEIVGLIVELVAFIPLGLIGFGGWLLLHSLGEVGQVLMVAGTIILWIIGSAFMFYCVIGIQGCLLTFFQAYALYFLGGRYQHLGDLLEPPAPNLASVPLSPDMSPLLPIENVP